MAAKSYLLYSYKMTHDTGFAPNPYHRKMTLANCKPRLRETIGKNKRIGSWIAGFTSKVLNGDDVGEERLIYLMQVSDFVTFAEYWKKFPQKRSNANSGRYEDKCGDNIYKPLTKDAELPKQFCIMPNPFHGEKNKVKDIGGKFVLIANEYYYFGNTPLVIPKRLRPSLPSGPHPTGCITQDALKFINYVKEHKLKRFASPHQICKKEIIKTKGGC